MGQTTGLRLIVFFNWVLLIDVNDADRNDGAEGPVVALLVPLADLNVALEQFDAGPRAAVVEPEKIPLVSADEGFRMSMVFQRQTGLLSLYSRGRLFILDFPLIDDDDVNRDAGRARGERVVADCPMLMDVVMVAGVGAVEPDGL